MIGCFVCKAAQQGVGVVVLQGGDFRAQGSEVLAQFRDAGVQGGSVAQGVAGGGEDAALQLGKDAFDGRQVFFLVA